MNNAITEEKLNKYLDLTKKALALVKKAEKDDKRMKEVEDLIDLSERYYSDALHFKEKGDYVLAFSAVNYAHAFLDAGARLKLFKVSDSSLFMVDEE
ncbi:DUF357 domain-containing protein [Candidatus Woesearchaeota archaeon]|nr:MAG: DUF357 domain-containing protein [Candidatus Woesearchaeota archaeon]